MKLQTFPTEIFSTINKAHTFCLAESNKYHLSFFCNRSEAQIENLWIPVDSSAVVNKVWKKEHFKEAIRVQQAMLSNENDVLSAEALLKVHSEFQRKPRQPRHCMRLQFSFQLLDIHRAVNDVNDEGRTFQNFCVG